MAFDAGSLGDLIVKITADARDLEKALNDADKKVKDGSAKMNVTLKGLASSSLAIGSAVAGFFALAVKATVDYGDELFDVSQKTGVAVERLSTLKFVAEQTESSFQSLATGLKFLNRNIFEANDGNEQAVKLFSRLGIATRDSAGEAIKADQVFDQIADKFSRLKDESEKTALAMQLFGRTGSDLIPVLNLGAEGIAELERTATDLGLKLTTENAKDIDKFSDNMKEFKATMGGLALELSKNVIPILDQLIQRVIKGLKEIQPFLQAVNEALQQTQSVDARLNEALGNSDPVIENARKELVALQEEKQRLNEQIVPNDQENDRLNRIADIAVQEERLNNLLRERTEIQRVAIEEQGIAQQTQAQANTLSAETQVSQWQNVVDKVRELNAVTSDQAIRVKNFAKELISLGDNINASFSKALSGLITGSLSGKEAIKQLGESLLQVIADFIAKEIVAMTIGKALQAAAVALGVASAAVLGAAWAPVAAFVSLATFGANAGPATAAVSGVVGLAATLAKVAAIPALAEGGIVTRPTLALIGEAGPEAVVPLSRGGGVGGLSIDRIEVNISGNADRSTVDYMIEQLGRKIEQESRGV